MNAIWKFHIERGLRNSIAMPRGARLLHVAAQDGAPHVWVVVDPDAPATKRTFAVVGTGWDFDAATHVYVGTWHDAPFVWHLFEVTP